METLTYLLPAIAIAMARPLGLLLVLPVFSTRVLGGAMVRNSLLLLIAIPMLPTVIGLPVVHATAAEWWPLTMLVAREVVIGALLGFFAAIPFWAIGMAGFMLDTVRGSSMASVLNPMLGEQASVFGILLSQVLTVVFLVSGGFNVLLSALYESYRMLPPALGFGLHGEFVPFVLRGWRAMWDLCLLFSMPAVAGMLLVDVALGLVNRSAQQLNVFFLAMPIKSAVALFLVAISLPYALAPYRQSFDGFGQTAEALIRFLR